MHTKCDERTDGRTDRGKTICPPNNSRGGIKMAAPMKADDSVSIQIKKNCGFTLLMFAFSTLKYPLICDE